MEAAAEAAGRPMPTVTGDDDGMARLVREAAARIRHTPNASRAVALPQQAVQLQGEAGVWAALTHAFHVARKAKLAVGTLSDRVFMKWESEQLTGAFKLRGAVNKLLCTPAEQLANGVSSGNHGLAVACALKSLPATANVKGTIYVPTTIQAGKEEKLRLYGVELLKVDLEVSGQGTIAVELFQQLTRGQMDYVFVSVGGGGLISGISALLKSVDPSIQVVGCLPAASDCMRRSVEAGRIVEMEHGDTLSDGTAGGIEPDSSTLLYCQRQVSVYVDRWVTVDEEEIAYAMRVVLQYHSKVIEGAAGVAVAALVKLKDELQGKSAVVISCGGNVSVNTVRRILDGSR
eukprot:jgi/Chlat1/7097/Chrsp57S06776